MSDDETKVSEQELQRRKQRELRGFAAGTLVVATMLSSLVMVGMVSAQNGSIESDSTVPVVVEGFVLMPVDATSVTISGGGTTTADDDITTSPVLDLPAADAPCSPPAAIAYRMYAGSDDTAVSWQVTGGEEDTGGGFAKVPASHLSSSASYTDDADGDGSPDWLTDNTWCPTHLARG